MALARPAVQQHIAIKALSDVLVPSPMDMAIAPMVMVLKRVILRRPSARRWQMTRSCQIAGLLVHQTSAAFMGAQPMALARPAVQQHIAIKALSDVLVPSPMDMAIVLMVTVLKKSLNLRRP